VLILLVISHSEELSVHLLGGTPKIVSSLIASVGFTVASILFNVYRCGVEGCSSVQAPGSWRNHIPSEMFHPIFAEHGIVRCAALAHAEEWQHRDASIDGARCVLCFSDGFVARPARSPVTPAALASTPPSNFSPFR
jgi:hypothetical protein